MWHISKPTNSEGWRLVCSSASTDDFHSRPDYGQRRHRKCTRSCNCTCWCTVFVIAPVCTHGCMQYHVSGTGHSTGGLSMEHFVWDDEKPFYIVDPRSTFHTCWDVLMAALLLLMLFMVPLNFFDGIADSLSGFNICVDAIFMADWCACMHSVACPPARPHAHARMRARTHARTHARTASRTSSRATLTKQAQSFWATKQFL